MWTCRARRCGASSEPTYVLGAFNPGLARLPNGNLLLMVRVAEALREPVSGDCVQAIRWTAGGYVLDRHKLARRGHERSAPVRAPRTATRRCWG
jgi:hypothetical protein